MTEFLPETYFHIGTHLYEVVGWTGDDEGLLRVKNCRTLHDLYLPKSEVERAEIVTPLDDTVTVPEDWA